jgi:hypothetical protein
MTGSYNNHFHVFDREQRNDVVLQASRDAIEGPTHILSPIRIVSGKWRGARALESRATNSLCSYRLATPPPLSRRAASAGVAVRCAH